jgi:hypothetical protein
MNRKHLLIALYLFALSSALVFAGALLKIQVVAFAGELMTGGMLVSVVSAGFFVAAILAKPRNKAIHS